MYEVLGEGQLSHLDKFVILGTRQPAQEAMEFSSMTIFKDTNTETSFYSSISYFNETLIGF